MISVVIPTLNAEAHLASCLNALVPAAVCGVLKEVIVVDGGSSDKTCEVADNAGARVLKFPKGRGRQLACGADAARSDWILFLHADTVLEDTWADEVSDFLHDRARAGVFALQFDKKGALPSIVTFGAMLRTRFFALPYGDQGLLISQELYRELGGYAPLPLFEDVDFIERLIRIKGRKGLQVFKTSAITSADRYEQNGYVKQVIANFNRLMRYKFGVEPDTLAQQYKKL